VNRKKGRTLRDGGKGAREGRREEGKEGGREGGRESVTYLSVGECLPPIYP